MLKSGSPRQRLMDIVAANLTAFLAGKPVAWRMEGLVEKLVFQGGGCGSFVCDWYSNYCRS